MDKQKIYRKAAILSALVGTLTLSGCGGMRLSSMDTLLQRDPPCNCVGKTAEDGKLYVNRDDKHELNLDGFLKQAKTDKKTSGEVLDDFLDCTVANLGPDADEKLKIYRGYVALAVLTRYAAFNYTGVIGGYADLNFQSYPGIQDDAMSTLARIDFADKILRLGSGLRDVVDSVHENDIAANPTLPYMKLIAPEKVGEIGRLRDVEKLHRTLSVLMVGVSAEKPTVARSRNLLTNLLAAIDGTLTNPGSLVDQGLKVVGKSLTLTTYGNAYLDDARKELETMKILGKPPEPTDWNFWANVIKDSCTHIAAATGATSHCAGG